MKRLALFLIFLPLVGCSSFSSAFQSLRMRPDLQAVVLEVKRVGVDLVLRVAQTWLGDRPSAQMMDVRITDPQQQAYVLGNVGPFSAIAANGIQRAASGEALEFVPTEIWALDGRSASKLQAVAADSMAALAAPEAAGTQNSEESMPRAGKVEIVDPRPPSGLEGCDGWEDQLVVLVRLSQLTKAKALIERCEP
jgi:hypothetical protein